MIYRRTVLLQLLQLICGECLPEKGCPFPQAQFDFLALVWDHVFYEIPSTLEMYIVAFPLLVGFEPVFKVSLNSSMWSQLFFSFQTKTSVLFPWKILALTIFFCVYVKNLHIICKQMYSKRRSNFRHPRLQGVTLNYKLEGIQVTDF